MFAFQKLQVYQDSKEFVKEVYKLIKGFPNNEQYALCDQLRRAAVSVPSNIAEGIGRFSTKERIHFLEIAFGSLMEVLCQLEIALDLGYIKREDLSKMQSIIEHIAKEMSGLRKYLMEKSESNQSRKTKDVGR